MDEYVTPLAHRIHALLLSGDRKQARKLLPRERVYPVGDDVRRRLGMRSS